MCLKLLFRKCGAYVLGFSFIKACSLADCSQPFLFYSRKFQGPYNVNYLKEMKSHLKNIQKSEAYLETKRAFTIEPFCEDT